MAAPDPEKRPTKGRDKDNYTKSQCVDSPTGADISIDERSQETLEQTPQLADASPKVTALTISENSHEILEQIRAPTIVEDSSGTDKHFPRKKTRQGRRGGWKVQMKKQKFYQKMEIKQKVSKHQGMGKMTTAEHSKVNRSDRYMTKGKMKKEDTKKMKMKTAEHIELDRSNQTFTKGKMKKGDTNTISAATKRGKIMTAINT